MNGGQPSFLVSWKDRNDFRSKVSASGQVGRHDERCSLDFLHGNVRSQRDFSLSSRELDKGFLDSSYSIGHGYGPSHVISRKYLDFHFKPPFFLLLAPFYQNGHGQKALYQIQSGHPE